MNKKRDILIYSGFDSSFSIILKHLKEHVNADFIVTSRDFEMRSIIESMDIALTLINCRSHGFGPQLFTQVPEIIRTPIVCLSTREAVLPKKIESETTVFTFPLENATDFHTIGRNINAILEMAESQASYVGKEDSKLKGESLINEKSLCRYVMELDQKNKALSEIKSRIDHLCETPEKSIKENLRSISRSINLYSLNKHYWDDFKLFFEKVNPTFIKKLTVKHPNLTTKDIKYCCYLKMNMSNNDIKNLLNINQESVRTHKYRLKRKLGIEREESLRSYFQRIVQLSDRAIA